MLYFGDFEACFELIPNSFEQLYLCKINDFHLLKESFLILVAKTLVNILAAVCA